MSEMAWNRRGEGPEDMAGAAFNALNPDFLTRYHSGLPTDGFKDCLQQEEAFALDRRAAVAVQHENWGGDHGEHHIWLRAQQAGYGAAPDEGSQW